MNKNTVQRILQLKGGQVRKRSVGFRPRVEALPIQGGFARATDPCRIWGGRDSWLVFASRTTRAWYAATVCSRDSSRPTARSKTAWSSA